MVRLASRIDHIPTHYRTAYYYAKLPILFPFFRRLPHFDFAAATALNRCLALCFIILRRPNALLTLLSIPPETTDLLGVLPQAMHNHGTPPRISPSISIPARQLIHCVPSNIQANFFPVLRQIFCLLSPVTFFDNGTSTIVHRPIPSLNVFFWDSVFWLCAICNLSFQAALWSPRR